MKDLKSGQQGAAGWQNRPIDHANAVAKCRPGLHPCATPKHRATGHTSAYAEMSKVHHLRIVIDHRATVINPAIK